MKKLASIFALTLILMGIGNAVMAQSSATATASATIIQPIGIQQQTDMEFGTIAVTSTGGTVTLPATNGTPTRTSTGGITLPNYATGSPLAASFKVTGESLYTYSITLPSNGHEIKTGTQTMTVDNFTCSEGTAGALNNSGEQIIYVGATVNVAGSQQPGTYTSSTPFTVTVNYN